MALQIAARTPPDLVLLDLRAMVNGIDRLGRHDGRDPNSFSIAVLNRSKLIVRASGNRNRPAVSGSILSRIDSATGAATINKTMEPAKILGVCAWRDFLLRRCRPPRS